jgi:hypothetical protein
MKELNRATRENPIVYAPVGHCIYCGQTKPPLGREHINALGLDGGFVLPKASCSACSAITGKVEQLCLRGMFGLFRTKLSMKSNRHKKKPQSFYISHQRGKTKIEPTLLPAFLIFPIFSVPSVLLTMDLRPLPLVITGHRVFNLSEPSPKLVQMHGPFAIDHPYNLIMFARMLSKIAHSFAVAEIGEENFLPYLKPVILGSDLSYIDSVVGQTKIFAESTSLDEAHHIALRCLPSVTGTPIDGEWVTVGIKLFSGHSNVTYVWWLENLRRQPLI